MLTVVRVLTFKWSTLRRLLVTICAAGATIGLMALGIWFFTPGPQNWYLNGENLGISVREFGNTNPSVCAATLIQGSFAPNNWPWGDNVNGHTPPLNFRWADSQWLKGCLHGFAIAKGYNDGT